MVRTEEKWKRLVAGHSGYSLSRPILRPLPLLLALPPFPGRHRMRVAPEPLAGGLGGLLDLRELALLVVLHVPPGEPLGDQYPVHIDAADTDVRDDPAVAVLVDLLDLDRLALAADGPLSLLAIVTTSTRPVVVSREPLLQRDRGQRTATSKRCVPPNTRRPCKSHAPLAPPRTRTRTRVRSRTRAYTHTRTRMRMGARAHSSRARGAMKPS